VQKANIKAAIDSEKKMDMENLIGLKEFPIREIFQKDFFTEMEV